MILKPRGLILSSSRRINTSLPHPLPNGERVMPMPLWWTISWLKKIREMLWDGFNNMWFDRISRWFWPSAQQKPKAFASLLMTLLASYCLPNPPQLYIPYPTPVQHHSSSLLSSCLHFVFRLLRQVIPQEQQPRPGLRCDDVAQILHVSQVAQNGTAKGDGTPQLLRG